MAKTTGTVTVKRSRNGTTIRATGSAAQALFEAMCRSVEKTVGVPVSAAPDGEASPNSFSQPTNQQ